MNNYLYEKPESARYNLTPILGPGLLIVEGDKHKQQVSLSIHLMFEPKNKFERAFSVELWYGSQPPNLGLYH